MTSPLLVFGWGNLSRGDDALGPLFVQRLSTVLSGSALGSRVDFLEDYQLQIEHALDLVSRECVLFVDASLSCAAPFEVSTLRPARDVSFTTHAISPESVMQVYRDLYHADPPPRTLLAIRGTSFDLGAQPGASALDYLTQALAWAQAWLEGDAVPASIAASVTSEATHA
ncbi:hydrogenase maturation protease [Caballeronia sp. LjRoot34]|uniref:hydrogenase maturation protease n=1 Tax=Caballeronia sp. LjRoot34 TaxID=3342325 RepID=UPI003ECD8E42